MHGGEGAYKVLVEGMKRPLAPKFVDDRVTLLIRIWKVQGPNLNPTAILTKTFRGLSHSLHKKCGY